MYITWVLDKSLISHVQQAHKARTSEAMDSRATDNSHRADSVDLRVVPHLATLRLAAPTRDRDLPVQAAMVRLAALSLVSSSNRVAISQTLATAMGPLEGTKHIVPLVTISS